MSKKGQDGAYFHQHESMCRILYLLTLIIELPCFRGGMNGVVFIVTSG